MSSEDKSQSAQSTENSLQPVIYGVLPSQQNDEINLSDLFSKLIDQWKLISTITAIGTLLAVVIALILPNVYQPSVTVSAPLSGNVAPVVTVNTLMGGKGGELPVTPQQVFNNYFNLLRSSSLLSEYVHENGYMKKLYPDSEKTESVLFAEFLTDLNVEIKEPTPEKKGGYIASPIRVAMSIKVQDEVVGVDLLNGYLQYVNVKLANDLQNDVNKTISNKIEILNKQIAKQREQHKRSREQTIQKMEKEGAKNIAVIKEQISALLKKAKADRATRIENTKEALAMAKSLNITTPTTFETLAQRSQSKKTANTAITVVDKQSLSLYLQGTKYLTTLIETLEKRESDEKYLTAINSLREKIYLIENDQALAELKKRKSDDPWIKELPTKLTLISTLEAVSPVFENLVAYSIDALAVVSDEKIKPKRSLIVILGLILSFLMAIFIAVVVGFRKPIV